MNLKFMTTWPTDSATPNQPTHFVYKVLRGLIEIYDLNELPKLTVLIYNYKSISNYTEVPDVPPKIHTIRQGHRWKAGNKIHPQIWLGKPYNSKVYQFAPIIPCTAAHSIILDTAAKKITLYKSHTDFTVLNQEQATILAIHDGFKNLDHFWQYFKKPLHGQLIQWTNYDYF